MKCPVCLKTDIQDLVYSQGYYRCNSCGYWFKDLTAFDYSFYNRDYWFKDDEILPIYQKMFYVFFENFILFDDVRYIIEFGAADGDFLWHVKNGFLMKGCMNVSYYYNDIKDLFRKKNEVFFSNSRDRFKKEIGKFEDVSIELCGRGAERAFSNVFMIDVIEHIRVDIYKIFDQVYDLLCNGGKFHVVTTNGDHLYAQQEFIYHQEHLRALTKKSVNIILKNLRKGGIYFKLEKLWEHPQGLLFLVFRRCK